MRQSGRQGDQGQVAGSVIARIDQAFIDLPEVRPGIEPYLRRLAECGWSEGVPPQAILRQVVVDVAAGLYRERADPPVDLLEFSDGAFDVLFDAAHERTILMHGLSRPAPRNSRGQNYHRGFLAELISTKAMPCRMRRAAGKEGLTTSRRHRRHGLRGRQHHRGASCASINLPVRPRTHRITRRPTSWRPIPNRDGACSVTAWWCLRTPARCFPMAGASRRTARPT
jgi:hypothetical protein